jgi:cytidine deaminase
MTQEQLINEGRQMAVLKDSGNGCFSGAVGAVIQTRTGKIFRGVSIACDCGIGFCAEHSAVAAMLTDRESEIQLIVAVNSDGKIYPPCGRCRELMFQVNKRNLDALIILSKTETIKLAELLPLRWQDVI